MMTDLPRRFDAEELRGAQERLLTELRTFDRAMHASLDEDKKEARTAGLVMRVWTLFMAYKRVITIGDEARKLREVFFETLLPKLLGPSRRVAKNAELSYLLILVDESALRAPGRALKEVDAAHYLGGLSLLSHAVQVAIFFAVRYGDKAAEEAVVFAEMKARYDAAGREAYDGSALSKTTRELLGILKAVGPPRDERFEEDGALLRRAAGRIRLRAPTARRGRRRQS